MLVVWKFTNNCIRSPAVFREACNCALHLLWIGSSDPEEADDLKKRSDYLILIEARLYDLPESQSDKARQFGLSVDQVRDLMAGKIHCTSSNQFRQMAA